MNKSEVINELATALSAAQGEIENAAKDAQNPFFKSAYADLASVRDAVRSPFAKHGLAVTQLLGNDAHGVTVETVLMHKSGQWLSGIVSVKPKQDDAQSLGSAVTYARRYSLSSIAGIASEIDDDGEGAMGRDEKQLVKRAIEAWTAPSKPVAKHEEPAVKAQDVVATAIDLMAKADWSGREAEAAAAPKIGEVTVISGRKIVGVKTPQGKQPRIALENDKTAYILGKGEPVPKEGETITADCTLKETASGAVYSELTNTAPF